MIPQRDPWLPLLVEPWAAAPRRPAISHLVLSPLAGSRMATGACAAGAGASVKGSSQPAARRAASLFPSPPFLGAAAAGAVDGARLPALRSGPSAKGSFQLAGDA